MILEVCNRNIISKRENLIIRFVTQIKRRWNFEFKLKNCFSWGKTRRLTYKIRIVIKKSSIRLRKRL
jgi:hypothetical protein